jgi:hypothetical protein
MESQERLMNLLDQFFDRDLAYVTGMLDAHTPDGNHRLSMTILWNLKSESSRKITAAEVTRLNLDMRVWWRERKWRPILVLQFHFNVMMHFFRLCPSLQDGSKWSRLFDEHSIAKLNAIETLLGNYITDIERQPDYTREIPNSRQWLLNYALEYAQQIWASQTHTQSRKRERQADQSVVPADLTALLSQLRADDTNSRISQNFENFEIF